MNLKYTSILTLFIFFGFIGNVNGQEIAKWDFEDTVTPVNVNSNISATNVEITPSQAVSFQNGSDGGGARIGNSGIWSQDLAFSDSGKYIEFSITPNSGYTIDYSSISVNLGRTSTGPQKVEILYSLDNFASSTTVITGGDVTSTNASSLTNFEIGNLDLPTGSITETLSIRIYGYAASSTGNFRFNDFIVNGSVSIIETSDPLILSNSVSFEGFNYSESNGPSTEQSFTVSGTNLTDDITLTPPTNYEISTGTSGAFIATNPITLSQSSGEVAETTIYVRLKAGLSTGDYVSENVTVSSSGASDITISLSGKVVPEFGIPFTNDFGNETKTSEAQTQGFTISSLDQRGGYIKIDNGQYVETPTIDFTEFDKVSITYTLAIFGGSGGQEFSTRVSNDGGATYTDIETQTANFDGSPYTFTIDLTGVNNVENGKLRFEMTGGSNSTRFSNLSISEVFEQQIKGSSGWRMLSFPVTGGTVEDISDDTAIQGVSGGDNPTSFNPNFLYFDSGTDTLGFVAPTNISTPFGDGKGFITYFYSNTEAGSSELPITLDIAGEEPSSDVTVALNTSGTYSLAGNPFTSNLDVSAINVGGEETLQNVYQIWDGASHIERDRTLTSESIVSTWQGFWVEHSSSATLTIPTSAKTETAPDATYFGKENADDNRSDIKFELISETTTDKAIRLSLRENAILGWDAADASKFQPLLTAYATLGFVGDDKLKSVYSAPYNLDEDVTIPMQLDVVGVSGEFELSWSGMASLPSGFSVMLNDAEEGTSVNLSEVESYTFMIASESAEKAKPLSVLNVKDRTTMKAKGNTERFSLTLMPSISVSNEPNGSQPEVFKLEQNYPNPFNPTTNISFAVANAGNVEISVYNVMGQKVATVLNENRAVGSYQVTFDASSLSSGIYYYRLQSAGQVLTRQMTLIK